MFLKAFTLLLSLAGAVTAFPAEKRTDDAIKIYAYGTGISGLQVYGGQDGKAYIAADVGDFNLTELIWQPPNADVEWNVSTADDVVTSAKFYIVTSSNAFDPAGFQRTNESAPAGAAMKGFTKYGSQIMWQNGTSWESKFWAKSTAVDGLYHLSWNVANINDATSVPVTIKTTAPADDFKQ